jgi:hypothetical protein
MSITFASNNPKRDEKVIKVNTLITFMGSIQIKYILSTKVTTSCKTFLRSRRHARNDEKSCR